MNIYHILGLIIILLVIITICVLYFKYGKSWFHKHKKKTTALIISTASVGVGLLLMTPTGNIVITPDIIGLPGNTIFQCSNGMYNFTTNQSLVFDPIIIHDNYVVFNQTGFNVTNKNNIGVNISIYHLINDVTGAVTGTEILDFNASSNGGLVWFNISGMYPSTHYQIKRNSSVITSPYSDTNGVLSFSNTLGSWYQFEIFVYPDTLNTTVRTDGEDYFVWLGGNTTAIYVTNNITGFDESTEYIAKLNNSGTWWNYYYGDGQGWNIYTYDVVKIMMDDTADNVTFNMTSNSEVTYDQARTVTLYHVGNGYNFTGYTSITDTTLSDISTSIGMTNYYPLALWNETRFTWDFYIVGWPYSTDRIVHQYDVIMTKISTDRTWSM